MQRNRWKQIVLALSLVLVALTACGQGNSAGAGATTPPAGSGGGGNLANTKWVLSSMDIGGTQRLPVPRAQPTLEFSATDASGKTGCNSFGGPYTVQGDKLNLGQLIQTMMGCPDDVMQQEKDYMAALNAIQSFAINGKQLTITSSTGILHFTQV